MKVTEHFIREEFDCKDGTKYPKEWIETRLKFLCEQLEILRREIGFPLHIISGFRTTEHNKKVGGKQHSQHLQGTAADIVCKDLSAPKLSFAIERLVKEGKMHNGGIGTYKTFVHYDIRKNPARWDG